MGAIIIFMVVAFIVCMVIVVVGGTMKGNNIKEDNNIAAQTIEAKLRAQNFNIEKQVGNHLTKLYVDNTHKQWAIKEKGTATQVRIYKYSDLIDFELIEDRDSVIKGSAGRALVGGALGGTKGAVIGSAGSRAVKENVSLLEIKIRTNDFEHPQYTIEFISGFAVSKNSQLYKECMNNAQDVIGVLHYIATNGGEIIYDDVQEQSVIKSQTIGEQIRELSQLKDDGIITDEEFEIKKKELLNL